VRQVKPGASSGCNSRLGKGNEPPHRESSLGLMEVTTWAKLIVSSDNGKRDARPLGERPASHWPTRLQFGLKTLQSGLTPNDQ
jgi:hypothetical protein